MRRLITISSFVFAICLLSSASIFAEDKIREEAIRPYVVLTGAHSPVNERSYFRATSNGEWIKLWLRHVGKSQDDYSRYYNRAGVPEIDFEQCMVIAIFLGSSWNCSGLVPISKIEDENKITFRFASKWYQTEMQGDKVTPYGFFILPRSTKAIVLEQGIEHGKGRRPIAWKWKQVAQFEKLPTYITAPEVLVMREKQAFLEDHFLAGIWYILPKGWKYSIIRQEGKMGHAHGLEEPLFSVDFANPEQSFTYTGALRKVTSSHPSLRLNFYKIADKRKILETIEKEKLYSWNIPTYFGETKEYIVVTSPAWINAGVYTEEAKGLYTPLEKALKTYFHTFE